MQGLFAAGSPAEGAPRPDLVPLPWHLAPFRTPTRSFRRGGQGKLLDSDMGCASGARGGSFLFDSKGVGSCLFLFRVQEPPSPRQVLHAGGQGGGRDKPNPWQLPCSPIPGVHTRPQSLGHQKSFRQELPPFRRHPWVGTSGVQSLPSQQPDGLCPFREAPPPPRT